MAQLVVWLLLPLGSFFLLCETSSFASPLYRLHTAHVHESMTRLTGVLDPEAFEPENMRKTGILARVFGLTSNCFVYYGWLHDVLDETLKRDKITLIHEKTLFGPKGRCAHKTIMMIYTEGMDEKMLVVLDRWGRRVRVQNAMSGKAVIQQRDLIWLKLPLNRLEYAYSETIARGYVIDSFYNSNYRIYVVTTNFIQTRIYELRIFIDDNFKLVPYFRETVIDVPFLISPPFEGMAVRVVHNLPDPSEVNSMGSMSGGGQPPMGVGPALTPNHLPIPQPAPQPANQPGPQPAAIPGPQPAPIPGPSPQTGAVPLPVPAPTPVPTPKPATVPLLPAAAPPNQSPNVTTNAASPNPAAGPSRVRRQFGFGGGGAKFVTGLIFIPLDKLLMTSAHPAVPTLSLHSKTLKGVVLQHRFEQLLYESKGQLFNVKLDEDGVEKLNSISIYLYYVPDEVNANGSVFHRIPSPLQCGYMFTTRKFFNERNFHRRMSYPHSIHRMKDRNILKKGWGELAPIFLGTIGAIILVSVGISCIVKQHQKKARRQGKSTSFSTNTF